MRGLDDLAKYPWLWLMRYLLTVRTITIACAESDGNLLVGGEMNAKIYLLMGPEALGGLHSSDEVYAAYLKKEDAEAAAAKHNEGRSYKEWSVVEIPLR